MMAPDLPLEPAPRYDFSSSTTRPALRLARCQAMLVPITPPPMIRMSEVAVMAESPCRPGRTLVTYVHDKTPPGNRGGHSAPGRRRELGGISLAGGCVCGFLPRFRILLSGAQ